jgi:hypothetical protein
MSEHVASARWRMAVRLAVAALVWSLGLVVAALTLPVESSSTASVSVDGVTLTHSTLVQENGVRALVLAAIPLLVSLTVAAAMVNRRRRSDAWSRPVAWGAIGLLALEAAAGILTIGAFILPVVILLILAVRLVPAAP